MTDDTLENKEDLARSRDFITDIAFKRIQMLEDASDAIDNKGGVLLGLLSVVIALILGGSRLGVSSPIEMLFFLLGAGLLFASLILLVCCIAPRPRRLDPDVEKLLNTHWHTGLDETRENVAASLQAAWKVNNRAHHAKTTLFACALWLAVAGIASIAVSVLVVRALA